MPPSPDLVERLERIYAQELDLEEAETLLAQPITQEEREEFLALVDWFRGRYPTPLDRLRYVRRAYARWTKNRPSGASPGTSASHGVENTTGQSEER